MSEAHFVLRLLGLVLLGVLLGIVVIKILHVFVPPLREQQDIWYCSIDEETKVCFKSQILFDKFIDGEVNVSHQKYEGNKI